MPAEWEDEFWHENHPMLSPFEGKSAKLSGVTLRPPLYNAEDYISALKQLFSHSAYGSGFGGSKGLKNSVLIEHSPSLGKGEFPSRDFPDTPPEMSMRKFLNGSELLFKLEADLRHAYPTFVQEFISVHCEGVTFVLEALKVIQTSIDQVTGLREQRKLFMDEQKCLQCVRLCLRNIEAVSKLSSYPGGLYPLAAAMISTVTTTRIIALEILTCVCAEGGPEGHFKVSEAVSTLRLRMGEPIRCKLLIGAVSSAPPGTFQAKGIRFFTAWVASAVSPKHKVHIQCELEEAGFNPTALRKSAELGGARESREVQTELDAWDRVSIDVDTLTRQNCQLRNSVATLQQELATLKDKLKRMDAPSKSEDFPPSRKRSSRPKRTEDLVTTPADSEEEAEQIHQILEDLNNIVNSELNGGSGAHRKPRKREKDIVPGQLSKFPPPRRSGPLSPRPWLGSSGTEEEDLSDLTNSPSPKLNDVRRVVQRLEKANHDVLDPSPKLYKKNGAKSKSSSPMLEAEPKPDYALGSGSIIPIFTHQKSMASKFANFRSSKLYSSSPDTQGLAEGPENNRVYLPSRKGSGNLRRSESLHTSLASINTEKAAAPSTETDKKKRLKKTSNIDKWKSLENLGGDENFTLRWRYAVPDLVTRDEKPSPHSSPKVKSGSGGHGVLELFNDYRQNRFSKGSKPSGGNGSMTSKPSGGNGTMSIFSRYSKKHAQGGKATSGSNSSSNSNNEAKEKDNSLKMFSLPPILVSQGVDITNHRICDLPSGLY